MSTSIIINPGPYNRTPYGVSRPAAACRFLESSANSFIFQAKQQYTGPYGSSNHAVWLPNQTFTTTANYKPSSQQQIIQFSANASSSLTPVDIVSDTKLFPNLQVDEYEQFDLTLNGIDLSGIRTTPNCSIEFITSVSDFILDEYPANASISTVLTGKTGSITTIESFVLEDSYFGTGTFKTTGEVNQSKYLDSYCYARFGINIERSQDVLPANVVWEYDRRTQTWSGPTHATGTNGFHIYIDWYFV